MRLIRRRHATRDAAIRVALTLRGPALALLAGVPLDAADRAVLGANAAAWQLFLSAECCAIPIARALRQAGAWQMLAPDARAVVAAAESREMQRVLAARGQLAEIDTLAASLGVMPIVLKGGATVADGTLVDLGDVDLLLPREAADLLGGALVARGCTRSTSGDDTLQRAGQLPLELHTEVPYGRAAGDAPAGASPAPLARSPDTSTLVPLADCRALRRLVGTAAVMMLLRHSVVFHPFRRGHLRDLVVIAEALGRCTPAELALVVRACADDPSGPELGDTLAMAQALRANVRVVDPPAVRRTAAHKYLWAAGAWRRAAQVAPRWPSMLCAALDRPALRYLPLRDALASRTQADPRWQLPVIGRYAPAAAARLSAATRLPYRTVLVVCALAAGPFARRQVARLVA